jgi:pimeloyl-ACP methyl ester carboxylesterase
MIHKRSKPRVGYFFLGLLILWVGIPAYQFFERRHELQRFSPRGELVYSDGVKLHLYCTGKKVNGRSTVILESGIGAPSLVWSLVQPGISRQARVCSYDRAGYGWSEPSPSPRTAKQIAQELHNLLQQAGEAPPYILAGHSFGGILIRVYVAEYPSEVSGVVLVDARHEDFFQRMPPEYLESDKNNLKRAKQLKLLTPLGVTRLAGEAGWLETFETYLSPLPDDIESEAWALMIYNPEHWSTAVAEREALEESYRQVKLKPLPLDMPLIVLTAENGVDAWRYSTSPVDGAAKTMWMEMQRELSQLSAKGQWLIVKDSGHYIYFDNPDSIINATISLLQSE